MTELNRTQESDRRLLPVVLDVRITHLEAIAEDVGEAVKSINESLKILTRLEERHEETRKAIDRAFAVLEKHDTRIISIESEMPTMKLGRGWVFAVVFGILSLVSLSAWTLINSPHPQQQESRR